MKKIFGLLVLAFISTFVNAQTVQGTIANEGSDAVTVFGKASADLTGVLFDNIVVCISIPEQTPTTTPTATIVTNSIPNLTWAVPSGYPHTTNGRTYYAFNGNDNNNGQQLTWLADIETPIVTIQFSEGTDSEIVYLDDRTGSGGGPGFDYWYVQIVGPGDVTEYGSRFFGVGATNQQDSYVPTSLPVSLPIELLSFTATPENKKVLLEWTTATEIDSKSFEVERSQDGLLFKYLTQVLAAGNSTEEIKYDINDLSPLPATSYYRLKQVDIDGQYEYSKTVSVTFQSSTAVSIFPNPFSNSLQLQLPDGNEETWQTRLMDITGKVYWQGKLNSGLQSIELPDLPAGVYFLEVNNRGQQVQVKVMKF